MSKLKINNNVPYGKKVEVWLNNGTQRIAIFGGDGYVRFLDCKHWLQNSICPRGSIVGWKEV